MPLTSGFRITLHWLGINGLINGVLLLSAPDELPPLRIFLASVMYWVCTFPLLLRRHRLSKDLPFVESICVAYFFYYGLGVFTGSVYVKRAPFEAPSVTPAVGWALAGIIMLQLAFYGGESALWWRGGGGRLPRICLPLRLVRMKALLLVLAAGLLVVSSWSIYFTVPTSIATIVGLASLVPLLFLCGLWQLWLRGELGLGHKLAAVVVFGLYCLLRLGRGTLAPVLIACAPFFFLYVRERQKLPWKSVLLLGLVLLPLMLTKVEFRLRTWEREDYSAAERLKIFFDITAESLAEPAFAYRALKRSSRRTSYLGILAYVIQQTPSRVPYWKGESYRSMLYTFVPRIVAPDKPKKEFGQRFGHRYSLIQAKDHKTVVNFAQLVEMYANFGKWGILFGMMVVGFFYRLLYTLLNHDEGGDGPPLVAAITFALLMNIESDASLVLGGTFAAVVIFYVSLSLLEFVFQSSAPAIGARVGARRRGQADVA